MARVTIDHNDLMLATSGKAIFKARGWIYELKYDGFRCLAIRAGKRIRLLSRNGRDMSPQFPELVAELGVIPHDVVIDGELVVVDGRGHTDWGRVRNRAVARKPETIKKSAVAGPAAIFAFDLLWRDGEDYRHFPLLVRKAVLRDTLKASSRVIYTQHFENSPAELWAFARKLAQEGIVAKDGTSPYVRGRSDRWVKIKTSAGADREKTRGRR